MKLVRMDISRYMNHQFCSSCYASSGSACFPAPTDDATILIKKVKCIWQNIYASGYSCAKAVVMYFGLVENDKCQSSIFEMQMREPENLSAARDRVNLRYYKLIMRYRAWVGRTCI